MTGALRYDQGKTEYHNWHPKVILNHCEIYVRDWSEDLPLQIICMVDWYFRGNSENFPFSERNMSSVLSYGSSKYEPLNYTKGMLYSRVFDSFMRHAMAAIQDGEAIDDVDELGNEGSGLLHSAHADCNVFFAYTYHVLGYDGGEWDDRPKDMREVPA